MKLILSFLALIPLIASAADYHHVHMRAVDTQTVATWYAANMGGDLVKLGPFDAVRYNKILLLFSPADRDGVDGSKFSGELKSSAGTGFDHLGFSFGELAKQMPKIIAAGAKLVKAPTDVLGKFQYGFIEDPWGQKIEVMQDPELIGFHHAHVLARDPAKTVSWYQDMFGGEVVTYKDLPPLPAIRYGDMWLIVSATETDLAPNMFTMLDHLGWGMPNLGIEMERIKKAGTKIAREMYAFNPQTNIGFIESPDGVTIELVETGSK